VARVFTREQFYELVWTKPITCLEPCASVLASYPMISASLERRVAHRLHTRDLFAGSPFAHRSGLRAGSAGANWRSAPSISRIVASRGLRPSWRNSTSSIGCAGSSPCSRQKLRPSRRHALRRSSPGHRIMWQSAKRAFLRRRSRSGSRPSICSATTTIMPSRRRDGTKRETWRACRWRISWSC